MPSGVPMAWMSNLYDHPPVVVEGGSGGTFTDIDGNGLLGIAIAAAVSVAASSLASQQIGLASEPISAGDALAPQAAAGMTGLERHRRKRTPAKAHSAPTPAAETAPSPETPEPESTEPQPPATVPAPPISGGSTPSGGEQDRGGSGGQADD